MQIPEFETHLVKTESCWNWLNVPSSNGYGQVQVNKKHWLPHRLSYTLYKGVIPKGLLVCHSCDNRLCVNPEHLWLGTHTDNQNDCVSKGRRNCPKGSKQHLAKFTESQVTTILNDSRTLAQIAMEYGVNPSTISRIKNQKTWKHV